MIYITMIIPTTMSINTITILSAQVSKDKSQISNETCQMSTPLTMSINTILIAQVRNAGLVLSTGSDFRTIVARNFSQGRKVFVAIWYHFVAPVILTIVARNFTHGRKVLDFVAPILSNNTYNCCPELYSWQKGLCCPNNNDICCLIVWWHNTLVRFGRYHSTFPPVSGFRELWHSKTRFYHGCHISFSPPIILTWIVIVKSYQTCQSQPKLWGDFLRMIHQKLDPQVFLLTGGPCSSVLNFHLLDFSWWP